MNGRYHGKRFASLILSCGLLTVAYFANNTEIFSAFSTTLGLLYGAYLTGQSATDWKNGK